MPESDLYTICNYRRVNERLTTAGQPQADQFITIAGHFDCVINLALPDSPGALPDEAERVRHAGCDYVHIPVNFNQPAVADLMEFFRVMQTRAAQRLFVHCALNWRVSAFVFLHRVINEQIPVAEAYADLLSVWTPDVVWQDFIESALRQYGYSSHQSGGHER